MPNLVQPNTAETADLSKPRIDGPAALRMFAEQSGTIEEIAAALKCSVLDLAMWRARPEVRARLRAVRRLHIGHARLLLARLAESLVAQSAAIACGSNEGGDIQRKACADLLKLIIAARTRRDTPRSQRHATDAHHQTGARTIGRRCSEARRQLSEEAIHEALRKMGEESRQRTLAEHTFPGLDPIP